MKKTRLAKGAKMREFSNFSHKTSLQADIKFSLQGSKKGVLIA